MSWSSKDYACPHAWNDVALDVEALCSAVAADSHHPVEAEGQLDPDLLPAKGSWTQCAKERTNKKKRQLDTAFGTERVACSRWIRDHLHCIAS